MSDFLKRIEGLSPKRLTLLALEQQSRLEAIEKESNDPVAIVGLGCRMPGGVRSPDDYWNLLSQGRDAVTEIPLRRWNIDDYFDADPEKPGHMATRWGGFIDEEDRFDAPFFGISRREAVSLDPQQRLLLETCWEALEHAGISPHSLSGSPTGVFVGISTLDYHTLLLSQGLENIDVYHATGTAPSTASGRIAYVLGLHGPNMAVDTACSSSLVSIHLACQSLRNKECKMALAGGVNMILLPDITIALSQANMMAPDGRCKTFDARADGFVRGEGCGIVVLKRLSEAVAAGDRVLALIRGSAVNQDGRSSGLTAPNGTAQVAVIRQALERAGVDAQDIGYVEAHGTGTSLGDPIEAQALATVLGAGRSAEHPLVVGSVKTNLGHLESAAGVAGLIKVALSLEHERIPAHLHFYEMNPHIDWRGVPVEIPVKGKEWKRGERRRLAGVSSFGFGGTNAHVIVEEAPPSLEHAAESTPRPVEFLALSAKSSAALEEETRRYATHLDANPGAVLEDVCFTANTGRAHFSERAVYLAPSREAMKTALAAQMPFARGRFERAGEVAFLFSGQGTQFEGMGRQLYATEPVFRRAIDQCDEILRTEIQSRLTDILYGNASELLNETTYTQPTQFAVQWALAELWRSWGVEPSVVVGHSLGEFAAATVAGVFSLEDGLKLTAARGRLMGSLPTGEGAMAAVLAPAAKVQEALRNMSAHVSIAAFNGPENVVVSGRQQEVEQIEREFLAAGFRVEKLRVALAAHSPHMAPIEDEFGRRAAEAKFGEPRIQLISSVTGRLCRPGELADGAYWRRQIREPVAFHAALETLSGLGCVAFLEVGPGSTLLGIGQELIGKDGQLWTPSIRRSRVDGEQMAESLAALYVRGVPVDFKKYYAGRERRKVAVPTYPFERQRYWPGPVAKSSNGTPRRAGLLGGRADSPIPTWRGSLAAENAGWMLDHKLNGTPVVAAACFLEAATQAARETLAAENVTVRDFELVAPLRLEEASAIETETVLITAPGGSASFRIFSRTAGDAGRSWTEHARGTVEFGGALPEIDLAAIRARFHAEGDPAEFYGQLSHTGIDLGERSRTISKLWTLPGEALTEVEASEAAAAWDGCFQTVGAAVACGSENSPDNQTYLLAGIERFQTNAPGATKLWAHARVVKESRGYTGELIVFSADGKVLTKAEKIWLRPVSAASVSTPLDWFYNVEWQPAEIGSTSTAGTAISGRERILATADSLAVSTGFSQYEVLRPELDALVSGYVVTALRELGVNFEPGATIDPARLARESGVLSRHQRLIERLLAMLDEDGVLRGLQVVRNPAVPDSAAVVASLTERFPAFSSEISLTARCGAALANVLRGTADPLQLLTNYGDFATLERLYTESPAARTFNGAAREAILEVAERSGGRTLRVLEIGAGTGGTTAYLLPVIGDCCAEYVFTDLSPAFLGRAEQRFRDHTCLRTMILDVELPPVEQGLPAGHFDIVVAANVLHATTDISRAVGHASQLVRPGGLLLLLEGTRPERWVDLTFGMTEGWWKFDDELRTTSPLLDIDAWINLLGKSGFSKAEAIQPKTSQQVLLLAQREEAESGLSGKRVLIVADSSKAEEELGRQLAASGARAQVTSVNDLEASLDESSYDHLLAGDGSTLEAVRALARRTGRQPRLWLLSRNAQCLVPPLPAEPDQALLWGLGRTVALEHPEFWGGLLDFDRAASDEEMASGVLATLGHSGVDDQFAWRVGQCYVPRIVRTQLPACEAPQFSAEGVYLITGGLGNLGLEVADWLVKHGASKLVLASRRGLREGSEETIERLRTAGANIEVVAADVASTEGIDTIRAAIPKGQLRGIVHTAAVFDSTPVDQISRQSMASVLRPKVDGAVALANLAKDEPLEFLVLFSSTTSLLGVAGMGAYAAANQFLDTLAFRLRAEGCPALAVNWGTWDRMGDLASDIREKYVKAGLHPMKSTLALAGMGQAIAAGISQVTIADIDWTRLKSLYESQRPRPLLDRVANLVVAPAPSSASSPAKGIAETLAEAAPDERLDILSAMVRGEAAAVLALEPDEVNVSLGLFEMGMDSLMTVELKRRLEQRCGQSLPSTLTFNYPSVQALTQYLAGVLGVAAIPAASEPPPAAAATDAEDVRKDLSEDELADLLARALET